MKGVDSIIRPAGARRGRTSRRARNRGATVWLVTRTVEMTSTTVAPLPIAPSRATSGALALDQARDRQPGLAQTQRCALIVDQDRELAETLAQALRSEFEPLRRVQIIRDVRLIGAALHSPTAAITVIDASAAGDDSVECYRRLRAAPGAEDIAAIFITASATSYRLSQLGADGGVVLRQPHCLDDIVSFVGEALAEDQD